MLLMRDAIVYAIKVWIYKERNFVTACSESSFIIRPGRAGNKIGKLKYVCRATLITCFQWAAPRDEWLHGRVLINSFWHIRVYMEIKLLSKTVFVWRLINGFAHREN